ncbi:MAG: CoA transferase, partial [candidate division NC10 bacterium]|nr:CoA transferase [candidate division NC10 bacterium]
MGPLQGIKVLDLSRILAGPFCSMILADLGAEVIKVEEPRKGDETRSWGPPFVGEESAYYLSINRNKKSIAIDLRQEAGREIVYRLAGRSDVALENFRPGVAEKLGVDYPSLKAVNPRLIYCSISGFG